MKGKNLWRTLLSSFKIRYFAVLGNEMFSVYQRKTLLQTEAAQQGIHICVRDVSAAATLVLYNQRVCQVALENKFPRG